MKSTNPSLPRLLGLSLASAIAFAAPQQKSQQIITSVYSKRAPHYKRTNLPDGSYRREYYVIANGRYSPGTAPNESIDQVQFPEVAGLVAQHLAQKGYHLADKADAASLLLQITWGTTMVFSDGMRSDNLAGVSAATQENNAAVAAYNRANETAMRAQGPAAAAAAGAAVRNAEARALAANDALSSQLMRNQMTENARAKINEDNARLIGYTEELSDRNDMSRYAGAGSTFDDLITDLENERYFVRITAYDFKKLREENKQTVLWTTVVSIDTRNTRFDEALAMMVANAAQQFGQGNGLIRRANEGTVSLGELQFISGAGNPPGQAAPKGKEQK